jgi:hypothetical protein
MTWYRVFAAAERAPALADIEACLAGAGVPVSRPFETDEGVWACLFVGELTVEVNRYQADEEGIRAELNSWAAFLETCEDDPRSRGLMERVIQSRQLFYIEEPSPAAREVCALLSRCLARLADGFYQVDDEGFFAADGTLLVAEPD